MKIVQLLILSVSVSTAFAGGRPLQATKAAVAPCKVKVVDDENGWPVPLVFLKTTHGLVYVTDNAGVAAIDAPELMGRETWFTVKSHGYGMKKDGFGNAGVRFVPRPGEEHVVKVTRRQIAKRLGRIGGAGLFAESQKCGEFLDAKESGEFGRDSVQTALYRGRVFWLWGDTNMQNYPLGIFNVTAATTPAPAFARPVPPVDPQYCGFTNANGRLRGVIKRQGGGPIWIFGEGTSVRCVEPDQGVLYTREERTVRMGRQKRELQDRQNRMDALEGTSEGSAHTGLHGMPVHRPQGKEVVALRQSVSVSAHS